MMGEANGRKGVDPSQMKIIAHRGYSGEYPENTRAAFVAAIEAGCDGFETDVHLTADGEPVILHDAELDRTSTGSGLVYKQTYRELLTYDFGAKYHPRFRGERILHLSELLELTREHGLLLNIELKFPRFAYPEIERKVISLVREYGMEDQTLLSSFNHISMKLCGELCPQIRTGLLYMNPLYRAERYAATCEAYALHPHHLLLQFEQGLASRAREQGMKLHAWTVNEPSDFERMRDLGADAVITDHPGRFYAAREAGKEARSWS